MSKRATTDFFERQDDARRKTGWLIFLFALAIVLLSAGMYLALGIALNPEAVPLLAEAEQGAYFDVQLAVLAVICTSAFIAIGSLWKSSALKQGGATVAEELGGREVDSGASDPLERRLVNVVEEMALASGVPVPRIYVLENEPGINAFAAGFSMNDAAVAVTRGALEQLTRDELQGVIAHEFSHILNGDMRLNIRLIGIVHGILLMYMTGRIMLHATGGRRRRSSSGNNKGAAAILAIGLIMMLFGLAGVLCGRLIKSAVSRQREYLADSAAVQFTRNPEGLAGALKKIGGFEHGSQLQAEQAEEVSHMCFEKSSSRGTLSKLTGQMMSTHPPLEERIKAIDPSFEPDRGFKRLGADTKRAQLGSERGASAATSGLAAGAAASGGGGAAAKPRGGHERSTKDRQLDYDMQADDVVNAVGETSPQRLVYCSTLLDEIPRPLMEARSSLMGAMAIVYTLLLDDDPAERQKQGQSLQRYADPGVVEESRKLWTAVSRLDDEFRLPLMDLLVPTLRRMTKEQFQNFSAMVDRLIQADDKVSFREFVLERVLLHRLEIAIYDADRSTVQIRSISKARRDIELVLSALAYVGHSDLNTATMAFDEGVQRLPDEIGGDVEFLSRNDWKFDSVGASMERLSVASPKIKKVFVDACAHCVMGDGQVVVEEAEMLRAICETLDVPLPPFIPEATRRR